MSGATSFKISFFDRFKMALGLHRKNSLSSLLAILRQPTNSLMTILVLAIALALPTVFYNFITNAQSVSSSWNSSVQIALFLKDDTTVEQAQNLTQDLSLKPEFEVVNFKTKEQALQEFKSGSGFSQALDYLAENPLPMVIELIPTESFNNAETLQTLASQLQDDRLVEFAKLDMDWINKYHSMISISREIGTFVSILLALGVLLIVGNTIRLAILNKRDEIEIIKLVGATDAFIRRPFLYTGFWYGLIAALMAALMVTLFMVILSESTTSLAALYESSFSLQGLSPTQTITLLGLGAGLGLFGSWVSVRKHLKDIQPH